MKMLKNEWTFSELKANECVYKEKEKQLKEQFLNSINNNNMMTETIES